MKIIGFVRAKKDPTLIPETIMNNEQANLDSNNENENKQLFKSEDVINKDSRVFKRHKNDVKKENISPGDNYSNKLKEENINNGAVSTDNIKDSTTREETYLNIMPLWQN